MSIVTEPNTPGVVPQTDFDAPADAAALRKAMKGLGTDEKAIIDIICHRSNEQRQHIQKEYNTQFTRILVDDIKSETSGNFQKLLLALLIPARDYRVRIVRDAIDRVGIDEDALIEFICGYSNREIQHLTHTYLERYGSHLIEDIAEVTTGYFKRFLVSILAGERDADNKMDYLLAHHDAALLLHAGELKIGTDASAFNVVFSKRNYAQIRLTDDEYKKITGHSLDEAVEAEFSDSMKEALLAILLSIRNRPEFFATRLYNSMVGIGTSDEQLIRIMVSRSEIDLMNIKYAFEERYGKSLKDWIKGDTSGDYKTCLLTLIQEA